MVLAAGNWLERRTVEALLLFASSASSNEALVCLVKKKILDRQFYTLCDWDSGKANSFLGNFGPDFKAKAQEAANGNGEIHSASLDFVGLVAERNVLAHGSQISDEAQFTPLQVRTKFYNAAGWVSWVGQFLTEDGPPSWNPPSAPPAEP